MLDVDTTGNKVVKRLIYFRYWPLFAMLAREPFSGRQARLRIYACICTKINCDVTVAVASNRVFFAIGHFMSRLE